MHHFSFVVNKLITLNFLLGYMDMDANMYDAQAGTIDVNEIAKNSNNRRVLRRLKRNEADPKKTLWIQNEHNTWEDIFPHSDYVPEGINDMGWLGYFIGKNNHLENLVIKSFVTTSGATVRDAIEPFLRGLSRNKSIQKIGFFGADIWGGEIFTMLTPFFKDNHILTHIKIKECDFGGQGARLFALAIGSSTNKSL